jgi:hypothetical protein
MNRRTTSPSFVVGQFIALLGEGAMNRHTTGGDRLMIA